MTENLISKIERLGAEAGLVMTPESRRFALLVRADVVAEWPKREFAGLTDDEIKEIVGPWGDTPIKGYTRKLFDQIEDKLREKNT